MQKHTLSHTHALTGTPTQAQAHLAQTGAGIVERDRRGEAERHGNLCKNVSLRHSVEQKVSEIGVGVEFFVISPSTAGMFNTAKDLTFTSS